MGRHELRGHAGDRAVGGLPRWSIGQPASRTPRFLDYPLDRGIRPASNMGSGDPSEVADGEVKAQLGNPGQELAQRDYEAQHADEEPTEPSDGDLVTYDHVRYWEHGSTKREPVLVNDPNRGDWEQIDGRKLRR